MDKYNEKINNLEKEELEVPASEASLYVKLMAYYLVENKLSDAKFLWSRIPESIKSENIELQKMNVLQKHLVCNNFADFFKNLNATEWSEEINPIIKDLEVATKDKAFKLIGKAYTSISQATLAEITNLNEDQLEKKCADLNWTLESFDQQFIVHPKKETPTPKIGVDSEYQLSKLTELVSFLEN